MAGSASPTRWRLHAGRSGAWFESPRSRRSLHSRRERCRVAPLGADWRRRKGERVKRLVVLLVTLATVAGFFVLFGGIAAGDVGLNGGDDDTDGAPVSGIYDFKDVDVGGGLTQCPQAGSPLDKQPKPIQI